MNKFRRLGLIDYNGKLTVRTEMLTDVVLHDRQHSLPVVTSSHTAPVEIPTNVVLCRWARHRAIAWAASLGILYRRRFLVAAVAAGSSRENLAAFQGRCVQFYTVFDQAD
jgi:hypothetical protein